jgi:hypothetical protein
LQKVDSFSSAIVFVAFILELFERGWFIDGHIATLMRHNDVEADVFFGVAFAFCEFVLFYVGNDFVGAEQFGDLYNLVDEIDALDERNLPENLSDALCTMPAIIIPAPQMSTR